MLQHAGEAILLGAAIVLGNAVAGGVAAVSAASVTKADHCAAAKARLGPAGFLESRTWTVPGQVATSRHSPPPLPL